MSCMNNGEIDRREKKSIKYIFYRQAHNMQRKGRDRQEKQRVIMQTHSDFYSVFILMVARKILAIILFLTF